MKIKETHIVPAITKQIRLQEYGVSIFASLPTKSSLKKALKKEIILLDGKPAKTSDWIIEGQEITLLEAENTVKKIFSLPLEVIFEDEVLAVVHKPAGIPTSGNYFKTIHNALPFNLKKSQMADALPAPLPVHRLDNPTSGLLLIAKSKLAQVTLNRLFQERKIQKTYHALVVGKVETDFHINTPIAEKEAETAIKVIAHYLIKGSHFSLIKAFPKTGRTHQIRIHLSEYGHAIVGDKLYGKTSEIIKNRGLFLTATGLEFQYPITKERLKLEQKLPKKYRTISNLEENT
ncbi:tRNA pseudouridine65 synthase/23S rRNA pseudouridine1911/1915/1917 synthase [Salegentibacter echinorum]|uniref:tRNA pseudouridine65 synthase/23S rRNA pseudouridine1911/1915/1917 synthase n=1 Tax=Salegentibacter echinorum TaxID=1073325 RepID=A0A1M5EP11_SALEC|nr:RluA family pseudouridine synthase [Salegentibacter echinorum]SHF80894.1 tRNA pseudouridine65 synthase/23S rRNA pseudouridine1911/1915/1917 synthase [Salegentibacter echinorum]